MNPTPFPDPAAAPAAKAFRRRELLVVLGMAAGGAVFGAVIARLGIDLGRALGGGSLRELFDFNLATLLLVPVMWLVVVLAHEFGHLLGGRLAGMRPLMLFAGPLHFEFGADGRTRLKRNRVKQSFGGLAACAPAVGMGRGAFALLVAGGPLASFAFGALLLPAAFAIGDWLGGVLFATAMLSLLVGLLTLVPLRAGGFMSDGGQLLGLARGDAETRQRLALASLMAQSYAGVRPRDWDAGLFAAATAEAKEPTLREVVALLRAALAEDTGRLDDADAEWRAVATRLGEPGAGSIAPAMRGALSLAVAIWLAQHRREPQAARRWLDAAGGGFNEPAMLAFAQAAIAWAEGDAGTARRKVEETRALLPRLADRGSALVLAESLDDISRDLDTNMTDATPLPGQA